MTLRRLILAACALAALSAVAPASALTLAVKQAIGVPAASPPPDYGIDFRLGSATGWSNTRASTAMAANNAGTWTDFATTTVRVTNRGALVELARQNVIKFNNDLTNVLWIKTNATAALDQTGIDGTSNSASSVLATGANATVLQAVVLASALRIPSAFVKRLVGTGPIDMTSDGGTTWVSISPCASTVALGMPECRMYIPVQTVTNPTFGFRLQTSGDKIAVAAVQNDNNATFISSPIFTGALNVTRAADLITLDTPPTFTDRVTIAASVVQDVPCALFATACVALSVDDSSINNRLAIQPAGATARGQGTLITAGAGATVNTSSPPPLRGGIRTTLIASFTPGLVSMSLDGGPVQTAATSSAFPTAINAVHLGSLGAGTLPLFGYVEAVYIWKNVALSTPQMRSWWSGR